MQYSRQQAETETEKVTLSVRTNIRSSVSVLINATACMLVMNWRCWSNGGISAEISLSRSFKVIGTDTDRSTTYDFLLRDPQ